MSHDPTCIHNVHNEITGPSLYCSGTCIHVIRHLARRHKLYMYILLISNKATIRQNINLPHQEGYGNNYDSTAISNPQV